jgi:hypothetical protein
MRDLNFTEEPLEKKVERRLIIDARDVSEMDKFKLAKNILLGSLFLYIGIIALFAFSVRLCIQEPMKEIWSFSSQGLFGIINLIIGFYFGGKTARS